MSERLPDNLAGLHSVFGQHAIERIFDGESLDVDGIEFVCEYSPNSTAERFFIVKPPELIERYRELGAGSWRGANIFELGIAEGGSTALMALLAQPRKLVAIDLEAQPLDALGEFIRMRGLDDSVRPYYGVDQSDRQRLLEIADAEFGDERLDVVIDDASHNYARTRSSFETLFPLVRPGGVFVIEDWRMDHIMHRAVLDAMRDDSSPYHEQVAESFRTSLADPEASRGKRKRTPLSRLAVELLLASATARGVVAKMSVDNYWLVAERGHAEVDAAEFRVGDHYYDPFGYLTSDC